MVRLLQGVGAIGRIKAKFVHPSEHIRAKYPNNLQDVTIVDGKVVRLEQKLVLQRQQLCIVFTHADFEGLELHTIRKHFVVTQQGDNDLLFDARTTEQQQEAKTAGIVPPQLEALQERVAVNVHLGNNDKELARSLQADVDDDNEPAPENIPINTTNSDGIFSSEWGKNGICNRKKSGAMDHVAKFLFGSREVRRTVLLIFESFFFKKFIQETIIEATNKELVVASLKATSYGEFLRFIGLWLIMATVQGPSREEWWSSRNVDVFEGAPYRLNQFMTRTRFNEILSHLRFTDKIPLRQRDPFWRVRDMLKEWNANMTRVFAPSWINCLDESMSTWINKWTCPGFMFVPQSRGRWETNTTQSPVP